MKNPTTEADELVWQLRNGADLSVKTTHARYKAADRIEHLQAQVEEMRTKLERGTRSSLQGNS